LDLFATLFSTRLPLFSVPLPERSSVGRGLLLPPSSRAQVGRGSLSQYDPLGSLVDLLAWVPRPDPACAGRFSKFRPGSQGAGSAPVGNSFWESRALWLTAWLWCMGLGDSRCVSGVFSFLRVAHRAFTRCVYAPQWRLWALLGSLLRVCPGASSEVDIANPLAFLSSSLSLSPSS